MGDPNATILDTMKRPLRDLRISVTDRCNFRCTYCMPEEIFHAGYKFLPRDKILTFEEITRLAALMVQRLGVTKLRLTGGEPLLRQNLERLIAMLASVEGAQDIALTTNAVRLPEQAQVLADAGLQRVTVSLDSLDDVVFRKMNGNRAGVEDVLKGLRAAEEAGLTPIKINAVIQRGVNEEAIVPLARFCREHGYVLRFIEYMDVGTVNGWRLDDVVSAREIVERVHAEFPLEKVARSYASETALRFRYQDGGGEIGLIASVTMPFCGDCTRLRLSPEGQIYTCLFAQHGIDLKAPLRAGASDDELFELIKGTWEKRTDAYSEERSSQTQPREKIQMYYIGG